MNDATVAILARLRAARLVPRWLSACAFVATGRRSPWTLTGPTYGDPHTGGEGVMPDGAIAWDPVT
jgi:hypothetical protein